MSDSSIIAAINNGDLTVFSKVYQTYYPHLVQHIQSFRGLSRDDANDIVHTVFQNILKNHKTWRTTEIKPYLYKSVQNSANRLLRIRSRERKFEKHLQSLPGYNILSQFADQDMLAEECLTVFNKAVSQLQPRDREIYRLKVEESLTTSEIAERLHISTNVVSRTLQRVREYLALHLRHNGWP